MLKGPSQSGFSLIELLMVVVIIGLLTTVAVPSLLGSREAAEKASVIGTLRTIHSNQTTYLSQRGRYARITELNTFMGNTLGRNSGSRIIKGNYTFINGITSLTTLASRYQLWAYKYENQYYLEAKFYLEQDGVIESVNP